MKTKKLLELINRMDKFMVSLANESGLVDTATADLLQTVGKMYTNQLKELANEIHFDAVTAACLIHNNCL